MPKTSDEASAGSPKDVEAERAVLGAMLLNEDAIPKAIDVLGEFGEHFYVSAHRDIYKAIIDLFRDRIPVDMVTIVERLRANGSLESSGGAVYICDVCDSVPTSSRVTEYANIVLEKQRRRMLIKACKASLSELSDPTTVLPDIKLSLEKTVFSLFSNEGRRPSQFLRELTQNEIGRLEDIVSGGKRPGIKSGFAVVDEILDPLQPGDFVLVAATPSVGKTTFVANMMIKVAEEQKVPVLFYSLEMRRESIVRKFMSILASVSLRKIEKNARWSASEERRVRDSIGRISDLNIKVDDNERITPFDFATRTRSAISEFGAGLVVIDYLQLMCVPGAENATAEVGEISKSLKSLAKETGIPIVALSQLNRQAANTPPQLSHLRQSGQLEQDADVVLLLSRLGNQQDEEADCFVRLDIAKQRNGPTGTCRLVFRKWCQQFQSVDEDGAPIDDRLPVEPEMQEELIF